MADPTSVGTIVFETRDSNDLQVQEYSCYNFFIKYTVEGLQTIALSMCIAFVNLMAALIFVKVSENEKNNNTGSENMMVFKFILVEAFINSGLNPVLQDTTFWKYQSIDS